MYFGKQWRAEGLIDMADAKIESSLEFKFKTKYLNLTFSQTVLAKTFGTIEYEYRIGTLLISIYPIYRSSRLTRTRFT